MVNLNERLIKYGALALLIYMPLHLLLAQWAGSLFGYADFWKGAKDVVLFGLAVISVWYLFKADFIRKSRRLMWLAWTAAAYIDIHFLFLMFADLDGESSLLATVYNLRLIALLVVGLAAARLYGKNPAYRQLVLKSLLLVSVFVALFGLLQMVTSNDFMERFGYSFDSGARPFFGIDSKPDLPRAFSSIRDPNSLGAYLLVVLSFVGASFIAGKKSLQKNWAVLGVLFGLVLILTYSRSAWLGAVVSAGVIAYLYRDKIGIKPLKRIAYGTLAAGLLVLLALPVIRDSYFYENVVFHSDETTIVADSNEKHVNYVVENTKEALSNPLGHGPGTAGIVSIRNPRGTVLTENYYIQVAYEVGIAGLALFVALNVLVYRLLLGSPRGPLQVALLASFWGLIVTNMLLHSWSNEAVATVWWLLAGYQIGLSKKFS